MESDTVIAPHAIDIKISAEDVGEIWRIIWNTDIWVNDVPVFKCAALLHLIGCLIGWLLFILLQ